MRRRRQSETPALATYYRTGEWPAFDPSAWPGDTLYVRWEAWWDAQEFVNDLAPDDLHAWTQSAEAGAPVMVGEDWIRALGVDARRGGHLVRNGKRF